MRQEGNALKIAENIVRLKNEIFARKDFYD